MSDPRGQVVIRRVAIGESRAEWAQAVARFDPAHAETLKEDRGTGVYRATLAGRDVVVKRWDLANPSSRVKSALRYSRAERHWRGSRLLELEGIRTARCLALATEIDREGGIAHVWLVMQHLQGSTLLEHIARAGADLGAEHRIAAALGRQVALFNATGLFNRDHKPSNLIVQPTGDIAVIDCVDIRQGLPGVGSARMLASLLIEPIGCGVPPRRVLQLRVLLEFARAVIGGDPTPETRRLQRDLIRRTAAKVRRVIRRHGNPRPQINPLESSLGSAAPNPR